MKISLPYGKDKNVTFEVPKENVCFIADRGKAPTLKKTQYEVARSLRNPISTSPLSDMVRSGDNIVIVVDDITRPTPQDVILPVLLDELNAAGVPDDDIEIVIALGTHRKMTEAEIREKYGSEIIERVSIINHDYRDLNNLIDIGKTESGIPVSINKSVYNADFVIGVGNIAPHPFAGWSGGGKIIQPGVCGEETTALTHVMAGKVKPIGKLVGRYNKVRCEIDKVALKAGLKMIINTILNQEDEIAYIVTGDPIKGFKEGVKVARRIYRPLVPSYADIIIVSSYPFDIDYWQAAKALCFASSAVKQGGTIVFLTPAPEGVSSSHTILRERAMLSYEENLKAIENGEVSDLIGGATVLLHSQIRERAEIICYSDGLTKGDKEALGFKHANTIQEAIEMALENQGEKAKIGVLKCGEVLPIIKNSKI